MQKIAAQTNAQQKHAPTKKPHEGGRPPGAGATTPAIRAISANRKQAAYHPGGGDAGCRCNHCSPAIKRFAILFPAGQRESRCAGLIKRAAYTARRFGVLRGVAWNVRAQTESLAVARPASSRIFIFGFRRWYS